MSNTFEFADRFGFEAPISFSDSTQNGEIYEGPIDYQKLADYLHNCGRFWYDHNDYKSKETVLVSGLGGAFGEAKVDVPFRVNSPNGFREVLLKGELNTKPGRVAIRQGKLFFSFKLTKDKDIAYTKKIRYELSNETAIKLTTSNYYDHVALSEYINTKDNEAVKELIKKKFKKVFVHAENDIGLLKWLYEQAPQFVLQDRGDDKLITDLMRLISYDKDGWLSWFRDSSSDGDGLTYTPFLLVANILLTPSGWSSSTNT